VHKYECPIAHALSESAIVRFNSQFSLNDVELGYSFKVKR